MMILIRILFPFSQQIVSSSFSLELLLLMMKETLLEEPLPLPLVEVHLVEEALELLIVFCPIVFLLTYLVPLVSFSSLLRAQFKHLKIKRFVKLPSAGLLLREFKFKTISQILFIASIDGGLFLSFIDVASYFALVIDC